MRYTFKNIVELLEKQVEFIYKEDKIQYKTTIDILMDIIGKIKEIGDNPDKDLLKELSRTYLDLYPPHGGLSDFFLWDDDFKIREAINEEYSKVAATLWDFFKKYL